MSAKPTPTLRSQWLGHELRRVREGAGLTLKDVGAFMQRDPSQVSRMESGVYPARVPDVLAYLDLAGIDDPAKRAMLKQLSQDAWQKGWWEGYRDDVAAALIDCMWLESRARRLCSYDINVPGLLQTEDYAAAVIRAGDADITDEQVARFVEVRMTRQRILHQDRDAGAESRQEQPLELHAILHEAALRHPVGSRKVMRAQLDRLSELSAKPNVRLRVLSLSTGAHPGMDGQFVVFEMPDPYPEVGYVDGQAGAIFVEGEKVDKLRQRYDRLCALALNVDDSAALIAAAAEDLE